MKTIDQTLQLGKLQNCFAPFLTVLATLKTTISPQWKISVLPNDPNQPHGENTLWFCGPTNNISKDDCDCEALCTSISTSSVNHFLCDEDEDDMENND